MTYYHSSKQAALDAGLPYEGYWTVDAELEPYNGWVLILRPRTLDVLQWPLAPLLEIAEVEFPQRLRKRPADRKTGPKIAVTMPKAPKVKAPVARPVAPVRELAGGQALTPAWAAQPAAPTPAPAPTPPPVIKPVSDAPSAPQAQALKPAWMR